MKEITNQKIVVGQFKKYKATTQEKIIMLSTWGKLKQLSNGLKN